MFASCIMVRSVVLHNKNDIPPIAFTVIIRASYFICVAEMRPRSRSDCMSVKSKAAEMNKTPKPRTSTVNEAYDGSVGSTLDLLSHQPLDEIRYLNNINFAYQKEGNFKHNYYV